MTGPAADPIGELASALEARLLPKVEGLVRDLVGSLVPGSAQIFAGRPTTGTGAPAAAEAPAEPQQGSPDDALLAGQSTAPAETASADSGAGEASSTAPAAPDAAQAPAASPEPVADLIQRLGLEPVAHVVDTITAWAHQHFGHPAITAWAHQHFGHPAG